MDLPNYTVINTLLGHLQVGPLTMNYVSQRFFGVRSTSVDIIGCLQRSTSLGTSQGVSPLCLVNVFGSLCCGQEHVVFTPSVGS